MKATVWPANPDLVPVPGGYVLTSRHQQHGVEIPVGFFTDLGSVPPVFGSALGLMAKANTAAYVFHDYLYSVGGKLPGRNLTRRQVDRIMYSDLVAAGVRPGVARLAYYAVVTRGYFYWGPKHPQWHRPNKPPHRK